MSSFFRSLVAVTAIALIVLLGVPIAAPLVMAQEDESASARDPAQFSRGAQAWSSHCARCHNMRDPQELSDEQWRTVMAHMRVRVGLSAQQAREILVFLQGSN